MGISNEVAEVVNARDSFPPTDVIQNGIECREIRVDIG